MVFSSPLFLFFFLPVTLFMVFAVRKEWRNIVLLVLSLLFYAWGEAELVFLMLASISFNYLFGIAIEDSKHSKFYLILAIIFNLGLLVLFKYLGFIFESLNSLLEFIGVSGPFNNNLNIRLPIGISFFTFQGLSYIIDVYRKDNPAQRSPINLALYISLFPQLIAGPIVRYGDIVKELAHRVITREGFSSGVYRFIYGLGKKVLIANTMAKVADDIFAQSPAGLGADIAWLGIIAYSLQIFFDFSGYSDMAIGLGRRFGFNFVENFNFPYVSKSIQEFWRRWHISLSSWFRDYLYIPLGGSRKGNARTYINLAIVFFATGLWHGASWSFVVWGFFHGFFIILERAFLSKLLSKVKYVIPNLYVLMVVVTGWVFFRADTLSLALDYIGSMYSFSEGYHSVYLHYYLTNEFIIALLFGLVISATYFDTFTIKLFNNPKVESVMYSFKLLASFAVLILCFIYLASGTYNPFIYFRF